MIEYKNTIGLYIQKKRTRTNDFSIISNDCWGSEVYHYLDLKFASPFVGLFVMAPCYIKLLKDFESNLYSTLQFINVSKYEQLNENRLKNNNFYPIGLLNDDIEIHFLHYKSQEDALVKWKRRLARVNKNKLFIKFDCGKDLCTYEHIKEFEQLHFENKICLSPKKYKEFKSIVYIKDWDSDGALMFPKTMKYFDVIGWVNNNLIKNYFLFKIFSKIFLKKIIHSIIEKN